MLNLYFTKEAIAYNLVHKYTQGLQVPKGLDWISILDQGSLHGALEFCPLTLGEPLAHPGRDVSTGLVLQL